MNTKQHEAVKCAARILCDLMTPITEAVSDIKTIVEAFDAALDLYQKSLNPSNKANDDLRQSVRSLSPGMRQSSTNSRRQSSSVLWLEKQFPGRDSMLSTAYANLSSFNETLPFSLALDLFEKVVENVQLQNEDPYPDLISACNNMANIARAKGQVNNATELYIKASFKAIGIADEYEQTDPNQLASVLSNLADLLEEKEEHLEAEDLLRKIVRLYEESNKENNIQVANALLKLGRLYDIQGKYRSSRDAYEQAMNILRGQNEGHELSLASAYSLLARATEISGDLKMAFYYYKQALYLWDGISKDWSLEVMLNYRSMANILQLEGNYEDALELYLKALYISEEKTGVDSPITACLCHSIGGLYQKFGALDLAIEYYDKTLDIKETVAQSRCF